MLFSPPSPPKWYAVFCSSSTKMVCCFLLLLHQNGMPFSPSHPLAPFIPFPPFFLSIIFNPGRKHSVQPASINGCSQSPNTPERDHRPGQQRNRLLQFRVGVIAVLAAHRLVRLGHHCCRCFVAYDSVSAGNGILVCTGGLKLQQVFSAGKSGE